MKLQKIVLREISQSKKIKIEDSIYRMYLDVSHVEKQDQKNVYQDCKEGKLIAIL